MAKRAALVLAVTMTPALAHTQNIVQEMTPVLIREAIAAGQANKDARGRAAGEVSLQALHRSGRHA